LGRQVRHHDHGEVTMGRVAAGLIHGGAQREGGVLAFRFDSELSGCAFTPGQRDPRGRASIARRSQAFGNDERADQRRTCLERGEEVG